MSSTGKLCFLSLGQKLDADSTVVIKTVLLHLQVIMDFIKSEPISHGEPYIMSSCGENGVTDLREEDPGTVQAMKAEREVTICICLLSCW
jgi:hypothetical protein